MNTTRLTAALAALVLALFIVTGMVPPAKAQMEAAAPIAPLAINGTYNTAPGWTTALADTDLGVVIELTFVGIPNGTQLSSEYAEEGIFFPGNDQVTALSNYQDGAGINGGGQDSPIEITTTSPMVGAGVIYKGAASMFAGLEFGAPPIFASQPCGSASQPNFIDFCGIVTSVPFQVFTVANWATGLVAVDNVYLAFKAEPPQEPNVAGCISTSGFPSQALSWTITRGGGGVGSLDEDGCFEFPAVPGSNYAIVIWGDTVK
jgi:hypothetical protein